VPVLSEHEETLLKEAAASIRKDVVRMIGVARSGHLASSLSIVEIMAWLYWHILNVKPEDPMWAERDRLVLSKGHGCPALYAALANRGFFDREELWNYRRLGTMLQGHPLVNRTPGIDASSGSLGMGLGVANGIALGLRMRGLDSRVFCITGDGELQEGAIWESAMTSTHYKLSQLTVIVDRNNTQMEGSVDQVMSIEPLKDKFIAFGWQVAEADGHDFQSLERAFVKKNAEKPLAIIARTVIGKGVSFLEGQRYKASMVLTRDLVDKALRELDSGGALLL
jgi:transketolase